MREKLSLFLDIGQIILANPFLNFYQIRPSLSLVVEPQIIDAVALGSLAGRSGGVGVQDSYQIGDSVLYVYKQNSLTQQKAGQAFILGKCSPNYNMEPPAMGTMLGSGITATNSQLYDLHEKQLQRVDWSHDNNSTGFLDLIGGDWSVHGKQSGMVVGDGYVGIRAGQNSLILDSLGRSITETALLHFINTVGSEESVNLFNDQVVHIKKYAGDIRQAYGTRFTEDYNQIASKGNTPPVFPIISTISSYISAKQDDVIGIKPDGTEDGIVASDRMEFSGRRKIVSKVGVAIERTNSLDRLRYSGAHISTDSGAEENRGEEEDEPSETTGGDNLKSAEKATTGGWLGTFFSSEKLKYTQVPFDKPEQLKTEGARHAHIRLLPSGGISIMDAWGSEILMEGGNIQISAANHLIHVTGRDEINIIHGVSMTNAGAIEMGSTTGPVDIYGKLGTKIGSGDKTTIEGRELYTFGDRATVQCSPLHQIISKTMDGVPARGIQLFSEEAPLNAIGQSLLLRGENASILSGGTTAFAMSSNRAVIGARMLQVTGTVLVKRENFTIDVPQVKSETPKSITINGGQAILETESHVIVGGSVAVNQSISAVEQIVSTTMAAVNTNMFGGIYRMKNSPDESKINEGFAKNFSDITKQLAKAASTGYEFMKEQMLKLRRFGFHVKTEKAVAINEPKFSKMYKKKDDAEAIAGAMTVDGKGDMTVIYPGPDFWSNDGMWEYYNRSLAEATPEKRDMKAVSEIALSQTKHIKYDMEFYN